MINCNPKKYFIARGTYIIYVLSINFTHIVRPRGSFGYHFNSHRGKNAVLSFLAIEFVGVLVSTVIAHSSIVPIVEMMTIVVLVLVLSTIKTRCLPVRHEEASLVVIFSEH